jgi:UPF0716 protein FxsA
VRLLGLILVFILGPLVELYVIYKVGHAIGAVPTLAILAADSLLGAWLMRSQGRAVWRRFNETLRAGQIPHREILDGVLVIFGGAFLITPGFITDIFGVALLLPPTRPLFRRLIERRIGARGAVRNERFRRGARERYDVDGTATAVRGEPSGQTPRGGGDPRRARLER